MVKPIMSLKSIYKKTIFLNENRNNLSTKIEKIKKWLVTRIHKGNEGAGVKWRYLGLG